MNEAIIPADETLFLLVATSDTIYIDDAMPALCDHQHIQDEAADLAYDLDADALIAVASARCIEGILAGRELLAEHDGPLVRSHQTIIAGAAHGERAIDLVSLFARYAV